MKNWKKKISVTVAAILLILLAISTAVALKYAQGRKTGSDITAPVIQLSPVKDIKLGNTVTAEEVITCPWHRWPVKANVTPGKGSQGTGNTRIGLSGIGWGSWKWKVSTKVQPYLNGKIEEGKIDVELNPPTAFDKQKSLSSTIPSFESAAIDTGTSQELSIAGSLMKKIVSNRTLLIITAIILLITIISVFLIFRNRTQTPVRIIPPWDIALLEFSKLRSELKEGKLSADLCISRLTDIIRNYLEKRFSLHAPTQTTVEFLEDLKRENSPLKSEDRNFLGDFMRAADLVKFAKLPADEKLFENAIVKAEALVITTKPVEQVDGRRSSAASGNSTVKTLIFIYVPLCLFSLGALII